MAAGCLGNQEAASPDELSGVRDGKVAAVLFHFVGTNPDGQPVKVFSEQYAIQYLLLSLGDFATGGEPTTSLRPMPWTPETNPDLPRGLYKSMLNVRYTVRLLSKESLDQGWCVMFLPPGYYYLGLNFFPGDPEFRIEVPAGMAVVYAGTIHFAVTKSWPGPIDKQATRIEDESPLAKDVAARDLPLLPPPVTRLAVRNTGPRLLGVPPAAAN
jgi:hypothetical protein